MTILLGALVALAAGLAALALVVRRMRRKKRELEAQNAALERALAAHSRLSEKREEINEWKIGQVEKASEDPASAAAAVIAANNARLQASAAGGAGDNPSCGPAKAKDRKA